jgi:hypothetical protein
MATLPEAFDKQLFGSLGARAVWLPGEDGAARRRRPCGANGRFNKVAHINAFGAQMETLRPQRHEPRPRQHQRLAEDLPGRGAAARHLEARSLGRRQRQARVHRQVAVPAQDPDARRGSIQNLLEIAATVAPQANWQHDKFFIVHEVYTAVDWSFLGTKEKSAAVEFSGKGAAILSFLSAGVTVGLKSSGSIEVKILGKGGAIAQNVARVKRDGQLVFDV